MRKTATFALVLCLMLGLSAMAAAKSMTAKGAVTASTDKSVTLKGKTADETYWTNDQSKIVKNHHNVTLADVKVGDWVEIWYSNKDGKSWITKLEILEAPKDKSKPGA
jgi:ABC-type enterochelin transport system substrate-binding protein